MPDNIERTIYKLELDSSGYINGVEQLSASTKKLTDQQERANKALQTNEVAMKNAAEELERAKKDLDDYTGANERYRKQLEKSFKDASANQVKLTQLVADNRKEYERATKAAQDFAAISARATVLQQGTTGGKIPTGPAPGVRSPVQAIEGIPQNIAEFEQLSIAIATAEQHLEGLDAASDEFKLLAPIVAKGKEALELYAKTTDRAAGSSLSLRAQIRQGKEELVKLEQAGLGATKQYFELEKQVARLTDEFGDQQQRIKILASDTKLLDFGKGAITAATSAFQTYASISILAGNESAELQKKTMQLFAAMQLLQSLEQLSNLTRREGIIAVHLQSASQAVYTSVIGASTGALKAYRIALLATGIGAAVVGIALLIAAFNRFNKATEEAAKKRKILDDINKEAVKSYAAEATHLEIIKTKLTDLNIPQSQRISLAKDYNKTAEEGNKIDIQQIDNIALINKAIDSQIAKIKQRALARAAENVIAQKAEALLLQQFKVQKDFKNVFETGEGAGGGAAFDPTQEIIDLKKQPAVSFSEAQKRALKILSLEALMKAKDEFDLVSKTAGGLINIDDLFKVDETKAGAGKGAGKIESVFVKTLNELLARLREASKKEIQSVDLIQDEFTDKLIDEINKIDELVDKGQLTKKQGGFLVKILEKVIGKESDKAIEDFKTKVAAAMQKINDELDSLRNKSIQDNINLLQDEFEKRSAQIDLNEKVELKAAEKTNKARLDQLDEVYATGILGEQEYQDAKQRFISNGEFAALNIIRKAAVDRQNLSADIFEKSVEQANIIFERLQLGNDKKTAAQITTDKALYQAGAITYEEFQKRITKALKDQKAERDRIRLLELNTDLKAIRDRVAAIKDGAEKEKLIRKALKIESDIAALQSGGVDDPGGRRVESFQDYAVAIGELTQSIVSFWQKANEAESQALDRSIALQEKRVEAAQRIAARGNAQYLKQEEDRLKELQIKKENAARRELAINAALQSSQLLVGITGAISKIATPAVGIAEVIASMAVIFASLATGYGLVKSLQGTQPKLAAGTKSVRRNGHPSGTDTIPAWLNEDEAVIPTHRNRAYRPSVSAIYDGTVPADAMNNFVNNYHRIRGVPQVNYGKIKDAAEMSVGYDGRLLEELKENNNLQRQTLRAMKNMSVSANIDRNGVAIAVNEYISQMEIDKHV